MKILRLCVALMAVSSLLFASCKKADQTYAKQKKKERLSIEDFMADRGMKVKDYNAFLKDTLTDLSENEYVLFEDKGLYMQIERRGKGEPLRDGQTKRYTVKVMEYNIMTRDTTLTNTFSVADVMTCKRVGDTYTASFVQGEMFTRYGAAVPSGWLIMFPFIKPGFLNGANAAKVRLIVPHASGTSNSASKVQPYYYEISISTEKWQ